MGRRGRRSTSCRRRRLCVREVRKKEWSECGSGWGGPLQTLAKPRHERRRGSSTSSASSDGAALHVSGPHRATLAWSAAPRLMARLHGVQRHRGWRGKKGLVERNFFELRSVREFFAPHRLVSSILPADSTWRLPTPPTATLAG